MPLQISVRVTLALLIAAVAIITFLVSFLPTYLNSVKAIDTAVQDMRNGTKNQIAESMTSYFTSIWDSVSQLQKLADNHVADISDYNFLEQYMVEKIDESRGFLGQIQYLNDAKYTWKTFDTTLGPFDAPEIYHIDYFFNNWTDYGMTSGFVKAENHSVWLASVPWFPLGAATRTRRVPPFIISSLGPFPVEEVQSGAVNVAWTAPQFNYDRWEVTCVGLVPDGLTQGRYLESLTSDRLSSILNGLTLRERARAILYDTKHSNGRLIAAREPITAFELLDTNSLLPLWEKIVAHFVHNISDTLMDELVSEDMVGRQAFINGSDLSLTLETKSAGTTYLEFIEIVQPGLQMRVALAMPLIDFMEEVNEGRTVALVASILCLFAVVLVATVLGHAITVPLVDLGVRMAKTAMFKEDSSSEEAGDRTSILSEVSRLQTSYYKMRDNLMKAKSYLPESLIRSAQSSDDASADDEDLDEEDEGEMESNNRSASVNRSHPRVLSRGRSSSASARRYQLESESSASVIHTDGASSRRTSHRATMLAPADGSSHSSVSALNTAASLSQKKVSMVVFNLMGFRNIVAKAGTAGTLDAQSTILSIVHKHVKENKGLIDYFQGDHIIASFNAATNVAVHSRRAASALVGATQEVTDSPLVRGSRLTAGMSSGHALVGNMGTQDLKRSCVVGPVFHEATQLERRVRNYPTISNLAFSRNPTELEITFQCRALDVGVLHTTKPGVFLTLTPKPQEGNASHEETEWMYELEANSLDKKRDPFALINQAFFCIVAGDPDDEACNILDSIVKNRKGETESTPTVEKPAIDVVDAGNSSCSNKELLMNQAIKNLEEVLYNLPWSQARGSSASAKSPPLAKEEVVEREEGKKLSDLSLPELARLLRLRYLMLQTKQEDAS